MAKPKPPVPADEPRRLKALERYHILDTAPELAFDDLTLLASTICKTPMSLISLVDRDRQWFKSARGITATQTPREVAFCGHAIMQDHILEVRDARLDERFAENALVTGDPHIRFYAGSPLITPEGHALGTICVIDRVPRKLTVEQQLALDALSRQASAQLELRKHTETLAKLATTDYLTGLYNVRIFREQLNEELSATAVLNRPLSLVLLDIDHFKGVNDTWGHLAGDATLREVAEVIRTVVRGCDMAARYGGEEFALLLPGLTGSDALAIADRVRGRVATAIFGVGAVTISAGVAMVTATDADAETLLLRSDIALYSSKQQGRNRCTLYTSEITVPPEEVPDDEETYVLARAA